MLTEQQMKEMKKQDELLGKGIAPDSQYYLPQKTDEADSYKYTTESSQPTEKMPDRYMQSSSDNFFKKFSFSGVDVAIILVIFGICLILLFKKIINKNSDDGTLHNDNIIIGPSTENFTDISAPTQIKSKEYIANKIDYKFCPFCGNKLKGLLLFCPYCGKQLPFNANDKEQ